MKPLFGYGSLILPTSLVSRFEDIDPAIERVYDETTSETIRTEALEKWETLRDRITYVPAKIRGFRRYYSLASDRGGTMLVAVRTDDPADWINGVLVFGLTDEERGQIAATEPGYEHAVVRNPRLEYYVDPDEIDRPAVDRTDRITLFANSTVPDPTSVDHPRNEVYHRRIVTGIQMLGETYGSDVAKAFYDDFCETTYEIPQDGSGAEFTTVKANNSHRGDTAWPPNR